MMPATCVPWPKPSPAVAAPGEVTTLATMRELPSAPLKSGSVAGDAGVDDRDADALARDAALPELVGAAWSSGTLVASWLLSRPVLCTRVLSVRPTTLRLGGERLGLLGRQLDGEAVDQRHAAGDLAAVRRDERLGLLLAEAGLNCTIAVTLRAGALVATAARRACADGAARGHRGAGDARHGSGHQGHGQPAAPAGFIDLGQRSGHLRVPLRIHLEAGGRAISLRGDL